MSRHPVTAVCPKYHHAVELIGRRWNGAIVSILLDGPARFAEIAAKIPDISDRMLAERLKELESERVVVRRVIPDTPVRVEYSLSDRGRALEPAIHALSQWAEEWIEPVR
jgi:DNA-binding HxlR family transcriptional regulator